MMKLAHKCDGYDRTKPKVFVGEWATREITKVETNGTVSYHWMPWGVPGRTHAEPACRAWRCRLHDRQGAEFRPHGDELFATLSCTFRIWKARYDLTTTDHSLLAAAYRDIDGGLRG
jgi:hypothetical protein